MYRGTTPTLCFTVMTQLDLSKVKTVWVTFQNFVHERTYTGEEVRVEAATKKMYVDMSQEETLAFSAGKVDIQIRMLMEDGKAYATDVVTTTVEEVLRDGVIGDDTDESGGSSGDNPGDGGTDGTDPGGDGDGGGVWGPGQLPGAEEQTFR